MNWLLLEESTGFIHRYILVSDRAERIYPILYIPLILLMLNRALYMHAKCCSHSLNRFNLPFSLNHHWLELNCFLNLGLRKLRPVIHSLINLKVNYISLLVGWYGKSESHQEGNSTWRYIWVSTSIVCERNSFPKGMWYWLWLTVKDNLEVMF